MTDNIGDLAPNSLTLPDLSTANRHETVNPTGLIGMSGAAIVCWNGSAWIQIAGNNTGD